MQASVKWMNSAKWEIRKLEEENEEEEEENEEEEEYIWHLWANLGEIDRLWANLGEMDRLWAN